MYLQARRIVNGWAGAHILDTRTLQDGRTVSNVQPFTHSEDRLDHGGFKSLVEESPESRISEQPKNTLHDSVFATATILPDKSSTNSVSKAGFA